MRRAARLRHGLGTRLLPILVLFGSSASAADPTITCSATGFAGNLDVRTSLILFRKPGVKYLVQCSTLYDVTRSQRVVVNCYELH